ncbi:MAG: S8 family serine peptidase [Anaerolineales bacterium]|nr:S8 family serine peptidase [Anaerolineales bacterium]
MNRYRIFRRMPLILALGILFLLIGFGGSTSASAFPDQTPPYQIHLLSGTLAPARGIQQQSKTALAAQGQAALEQGLTRIHSLVQLYEYPTDDQIEALRKAGIELLQYVPYYTWMASIPADQPVNVLSNPQVRWAGRWTAEDKLHPSIRKNEWGSYAIHPEVNAVMVMMLLHEDVPLARGASLAEAHGGVAMPPIEGIHGMTVWIPPENLLSLAGEEEVVWIEEGPAPLTPNNDGVRTTMQVTPLYSAPYSLNGSGVRVFVFDGGWVRTTHNTFNPGARVTRFGGTTTADHPTHVAGTVAGDGDGGRGQGVAPSATIVSAEYQQTAGTMLFWDNAGDIQADYATARNTYNIDFATNSIGSNTASNGYPCEREGNYGVSSNMLDGIVRGDNLTVGSAVLMTWANGNERTGGSARCGSNYLTTAPPSCAKNPIQVGATNSDYDSMTSFSSWGPCDDGRLKPIVSAPGCELGRASGETYIYSSLNTSDSAYGGSGWCGTSMATPATAGVVALMMQDWRAQGYGGANDRPLPALFKAMLMHTARDLGQDGPDYIYGYGEVDAKAAVDLIRDGRPLGGYGPTNWGTDSITQGAVDSFQVTVPADIAEFKISLAWDDYAAAAYSAIALVNNLDLEVVSPGGTTYYPWSLNPAAPYQTATTGVNNRDNQEQVLLTNPAAGVWTVRVRGLTVPQGPQTYGLVYSVRYPVVETSTCAQQIINGGFESDTSSWTLSGAARVAAPATGHGSYSLRLGGANRASHTAYQTVSIPAGVSKADLSFWWYMTTAEPLGLPDDRFYAEVRNTSGTVLAALDYRSEGWQTGQWMKSENMDLTPWAGQTVRIYFYATTSQRNITSFFVDDISLDICLTVTRTWWLGKTTAWNTTSNWSSGAVPTCATNVIIPATPAGGNFPQVNSNLEVGNLTIQSGAQVNMSANTLGVCGNWDAQGSGQMNASGGTVVFKGSSAQTINMPAGTNGQFYHLQVGDGSSTQTVSALSALEIDGNLTIRSGAALSASSYAHQLSGNWDLQGGFTHGNGTIQFIGSTAQSIGGTQPATFYNLTVNNSAGVVLAQNENAIGTLTLTNGRLTLGAYTLTLGSSASISGAFDANRMILANSTGLMCKQFPNSPTFPLAFTYPIGDDTGAVEYSPASLSFTAGTFASAQACLRLSNATHPDNTAYNHLTRYWEVTSSGISGFSGAATFDYLQADVAGEESLLRGMKFDSSVAQWGNPVDTINNRFSMDVSSFSEFTAGNSPTGELVFGFQAREVDEGILVQWSIDREGDIDGYYVYRSMNSLEHGEKISGLIEVKDPEFPPINTYTYLDTTAEPGVVYYYWLEIQIIGGEVDWAGPEMARTYFDIYLPVLKREG